MPDHLGEDMRKTKADDTKEEKEIKGSYNCLCLFFALTNVCLYVSALDERDIEILKTYVSITAYLLNRVNLYCASSLVSVLGPRTIY